MTESVLSHLPPEVLIKIFQQLDFYDIQCVRLCCKHLYAVTMLPEFASKEVFKITRGVLDDNHPAARVLLTKRVEKLYLKSVTFGNVDNLFRHIGTSLKGLSLKSVSITPALQLTFDHLPHLESLRISHIKTPFFMDDLDILAIRGWPAIKNLILIGNGSRVNKYLLTCLLKCQNLEQLIIEFMQVDEPEVLAVLEKHSHSLRKLDLRLYERGPLQVSKWTNVLGQMQLNELCMKGAFSSEIIFSATQDQKNLKTLDVTGSIGVDDRFMALIGDHLSGLEKLILSYCGRITDNGVKELVKLSNLKIFELTYCNLITSEGVHGVIGPTPKLNINELHLQDLDIDEKLIISCANALPNLRILKISGCSKAVTDNALQEIFDCQRQLRELRVDNCTHFSDGGLLGLNTGDSVQNLKFLQRLSLRGCRQLTDVTLNCSLKLPNLKFLDIAHCEKMSKYGIASLVENCKALEELFLTNTDRLSLDSIQNLIFGLGRLRMLTINNCSGDLKALALKCRKVSFCSVQNSITIRK